MTDERLQALYRQAAAQRAAMPGDCAVSPEAMVDVLTGRLPESERRRILLVIMGDPRCQREFDLLRAMVAGGPGLPRARDLPPARVLAIAATVVLLAGAGLWWRAWQTRVRSEPLREGSTGEVRLVAPEPDVGSRSGLQFVWRSLPGALEYEFSLVTPGGRLVYEATSTDTALVLPDSVSVPAGDDLRWWVDARTAEGGQVRSTLRRLRISHQ